MVWGLTGGIGGMAAGTALRLGSAVGGVMIGRKLDTEEKPTLIRVIPEPDMPQNDSVYAPADAATPSANLSIAPQSSPTAAVPPGRARGDEDVVLITKSGNKLIRRGAKKAPEKTVATDWPVVPNRSPENWPF